MAQGIAVHLRHHDVADHQVGNRGQRFLQTLLTVLGFDDLVALCQVLPDVAAHVGVVLHHQNELRRFARLQDFRQRV